MSFQKGSTPWNKGLTKEKDNRLDYKRSSKSRFKKGHIPFNKNSNSGSFKKGLIPWNKGKPYLSKNKHWNWKGGKTKLIEQIRKSPKYKEWRLAIFIRDDFTCQNCGKVGSGNLEAHHSKAISRILREVHIKFFDEAMNCVELWDKNNGVTLCKECHEKTESYLSGGRWL